MKQLMAICQTVRSACLKKKIYKSVSKFIEIFRKNTQETFTLIVSRNCFSTLVQR